MQKSFYALGLIIMSRYSPVAIQYNSFPFRNKIFNNLYSPTGPGPELKLIILDDISYLNVLSRKFLFGKIKQVAPGNILSAITLEHPSDPEQQRKVCG